MNKKKDAAYWIKALSLIEHPEGGYFKETYRADEELATENLPERYTSSRCFGTSIYFLLTTSSVSNFHRLNSDEIWHFHCGGAARIHFISPEGEYYCRSIGSFLEEGQQLQVVIPRHSWFAAEVISDDFILVGCTVAPGFDFADFELAEKGQLLKEFPDLAELIDKFTR